MNIPIIQQQKNLQPIPPPAGSIFTFIPPPINNLSIQQTTQLKKIIGYGQHTVQSLKIFGQDQLIDLNKKIKLPQPLFIDQIQKIKIKKIVKTLYEKMIESFKISAGQTQQIINLKTNFDKIKEKSDQLWKVGQQVKVAESKIKIWKLMEKETQELNAKAEEIQIFVESMIIYCKKQSEKYIQQQQNQQ